MALGQPNGFVVYASSDAQVNKQRSLLDSKNLSRCILAVGLLVVIAVIVGSTSRTDSQLQRGTSESSEKHEAFEVEKKLEDLSKDLNDRDAIKQALLSPLQINEMLKTSAGSAYSRNFFASELAKRKMVEYRAADKDYELSPAVMVPWVHWPGHPDTGKDDRY
mmetsp:Transcript_40835/g.109308  ORF Transcript_40835/g.109308 Transcript_40835/m.109308 type:complete len:163 (+) Transcript_40835:1-489(+)